MAKTALQQILRIFRKPEIQSNLEIWFDLLHRINEVLGIKDNDPRVGYTILMKGRGGLTVNINQRRVLGLFNEEELVWAFIINEEDIPVVQRLPGYLEQGLPFAAGKSARVVSFADFKNTEPPQALLDAWDKSLIDSLATGNGSPFKKFHYSFLNIAAESASARQLIQKWIKSDDLTVAELESPEVKAIFGDTLLNLEIKEEDNLNQEIVRYWLAGSTYDSKDEQLDRFLAKGIWENGYDHKYTMVTKSVKPGDRIAIKASFTRGPGNSIGVGLLKARGIVTDNPGDGNILYVDWEPKRINQEFVFLSGYRKTISELTDPEKIKAIFPDTLESHSKNATKMKSNLNTILFGPPGTGKTYNTINKALEIIDPAEYEKLKDDRKKITDRFTALQYDPETEKGQIAFVTFHQSMSYEEFIEGIKPMDPEVSGGPVIYSIVPGIFKQLAKAATSRGSNFVEKVEWLKKECSEADNKEPIKIDTGNTQFLVSYNGGITFRIKPLQSARPENDYPASIENIRKVYDGAARKEVYNPTYVIGILNFLYKNGLDRPENSKIQNAKPYVLIIDEINRGNISQILGELITLIEEDKRLGASEQLEVILPYSKRKFSLPPNLYIIGTMNTADRSVEALDTALRRRFSFIEMPPKPELLKDYGQLFPLPEVSGQFLDLAQMLSVINRRIEKLIDKDHCIGHAFFMGINKASSPVQELRNVFQDKILPLLQEYFYGNYGKMELVIGKDFFVPEPAGKATATTFFAASSDYEGKEDAFERKVYHLKNWHEKVEETGELRYSDEALLQAISRI